MNFEKIELIGFKSFADKMEINFDNGVTAIVGPNGCGKSNISDAIRWVLGEQSAKSLRGSSMTDVIFNGTQNRRSLSYCEVSLYFDNSSGIFKSCDYQQVILTRKLFRSGESEYYINKQPARMRDIIDLLHECGVSKNGYTVIGQGKVAEILSSKPEDRRAIFEEAVGISKTKSMKLESERKLERTRDNITRLIDLTSEVTRQLEPAEKSAEKTRKFLELSETLKYHEINNFLYRHENASSAKQRISLRINGLNEELAVNENELEKAEQDYARHVKERDESDAALNALHEEILTKSLSQEKLDGETKIYREKISYLKSEIERLESDKKDRIEKIELLSKAILAKTQYLDECMKEKATLAAESSEIDAKLSVLYKKISEGESLTRSSQTEILNTVETLADINKNIGSLDAEKSVISSRLGEIATEVEVLKRDISALSMEKQRLETDLNTSIHTKEECVKYIENAEKEISASNESISVLSNDIYKLNIEVNNLVARQKIYANMKETLEGFPASVRRLMSDAKTNAVLKSHIKDVVAQVVKTDKRYEVAVETAIGNALQNVITQTPEDAQYVIEYLKRIEAGRVTCLPITSVKPRYDSDELISAKRMSGVIDSAVNLVRFDAQYRSVIEYLLGNTLIVDTSEHALAISKAYRFGFKVVTLDGDVFNPSGAVSGGSRRQNAASMISTERILEQISEDLIEKRARLDKLTAEKAEKTQRSNDLVTKLDEFNKKLNEAKQSISALGATLSSLDAVLEEKKAQLKKDTDSYNAVVGRITEIDREFDDITEGNKKLNEKKRSAADESEKIQKEFDALKSERDELSRSLGEKTSRISFLEAEINAANADIARMRDDVSEAETIIKNDEADVEYDNGQIVKFYKKIEQLTLSAEETSGIKELREKLVSVEDRKQKLSDAIAQDDLKRKIHNSEIAKITEKKHDEEINISRIDSELEYISKRVLEGYELDYESAKDMRDDNYDFTTSNQEIATLHRKIASLGTINPDAIEECRALRERYDEYNTQKEDLEKAEADLKNVIKQLTEEMLSSFNKGFDEIRTHFKRIFKELFGGGSADLILDYSEVEDPLEAGVEIVAEPPGKKLQKISLLSGGEMALTAIAILFAILKLRPMPFCVLDEIEAALDDANVERFARYLKNFSAETQFVVITHKKVTMELSDALFGVTMQEKGVSKIVSVKLADIKDTIDDN